MTPSIRPDVLEPALRGIVVAKILDVLEFMIAELIGCLDEVILGMLAAVGTAGDVDGAREAVVLLLALAVICLKLRSGSVMLQIRRSKK